MAIQKEGTKKFLKTVDELFEHFTLGISEEVRNFVKTTVMGPAIEELDKLITESRPPTFYLVGSSGVGKSSLINALVDRKVSEVGEYKPTTCESEPFYIPFYDKKGQTIATWNIVDSRGLFEITAPEKCEVEEEEIDSIILNDLLNSQPDIILHITTPDHLRRSREEFYKLAHILNEYRNKTGMDIPRISIINKVDTLPPKFEWPPAERKLAKINEFLNFVVSDVLNLSKEELTEAKKGDPVRGYIVKVKERAPREVDNNIGDYVAIIPVSTLWEDEGNKYFWNIETLKHVLGDNLSKNALLDYAQGVKTKGLLRKIASNLTNRFATIAAGIGAFPIPMADIAVLTPLQILLVSFIAGLSCRKIDDEDNIKEFLSAVGLVGGAGWTFRQMARQLVKLIPGAGSIISGGIAAAGTYAIGKAAEAYFFGNASKEELDKIMDSAKQDWEQN